VADHFGDEFFLDGVGLPGLLETLEETVVFGLVVVGQDAKAAAGGERKKKGVGSAFLGVIAADFDRPVGAGAISGRHANEPSNWTAADFRGSRGEFPSTQGLAES